MNRRKRIEAKGYKVISCCGYRNGVQCVTSVIAKTDFRNIKANSVTELHHIIFGY